MLTGFHLHLEAHHILRNQGIEAASASRARSRTLVTLAERALRSGLPLLEPRAVHQSWEVESICGDRIWLRGGKGLNSPLLAHNLRGARQITAIVASIGAALEQHISQITPRQPALALALDALGTSALHALAGEICLNLAAQADPGWQVSLPLSPGLDGWELLSGQTEIFELVDPAPLGVRLLPSGMMTPRQSISFVLGFGPDISNEGQTCDFCSLRQSCRYRPPHVPD